MEPRRAGSACAPSPTPEDIFTVEIDSVVDVYNAFVIGANEAIATHGDIFDFLGFWTTFSIRGGIPHASYYPVKSETLGIGKVPFDDHASLGIIGERLQGMILMFDLDAPHWQSGTGPEADFTRIAISHEFLHRYAAYLPALPGARLLEGDDICGRPWHWHHSLDVQGSGLGSIEWVGISPAVHGPNCLEDVTPLCFNSDTGGVYSYLDLYLMGYASAAQAQAGISEMRYLDEGCTSPYNGAISTFTMDDVIATAGERVPGAAAEQKRFRTAWGIVLVAGQDLTPERQNKVVGMIDQFTLDWQTNTLGRGLMNNTPRPFCDEVPPPIPTASTYGVLLMSLTILIAASCILRRRNNPTVLGL